MAGLIRDSAYQEQRPFSTPNCKNVRPIGSLSGRERGGSRPGLGKYSQGVLGGPVNMLGEVEFLKTDKSDFWADSFKGGEIGSVWADVPWIPGAITRPGIEPDSQIASVRLADGPKAVVRVPLTSFDTSLKYQLEIFIAPFGGQWGGTHRVFARMADVGPDVTADGVELALTMTGTSGDYTGSLTSYVAGVPTVTAFTPGSVGSVKAGWFKVLIDGSSVSCSWHGATVLAPTVVPAAAGTRVGFGVEATVDPGQVNVDSFRVQYFRSDFREQPVRILAAGAGGGIFREEFFGEMSSVSTPTSIVDDRLVHTDQHFQKLYLGDHGDPVVTITDGVASGTTITSASVPDWAVLGASADDHVVEITGSSLGSTINGTYGISGLGPSLTIDASLAAATAVKLRIARSVKVYDPASGTLTLLRAGTDPDTGLKLGFVPVGHPVIAVFRDRLFLGGADNNPHIWFASRSGVLDDWDLSVTSGDPQRAVAGSSTEMGNLAEKITAFVAFSDDGMLIGAQDSLWLMRGDPGLLGTLDNVSRTVGVISRGAWCRSETGEVIFLARSGLYMLPPGMASFPVELSRKNLPLEMRDIDPRLTTINMAYDVRDRGVHIFLTPVDERSTKHFWFDWDRKSFWLMGYESDHEPTSILFFHANHSEDQRAILGCRDGFLRFHHDLFENDDGTAISSFVIYGPFMPGGDDNYEGILSEISAKLSLRSGSVDWAVRVGETAEELVAVDELMAGSDASGKWLAGRSLMEHPRSRGAFLVIKVAGGVDLDHAWALEGVNVAFARAGRMRKA